MHPFPMEPYDPNQDLPLQKGWEKGKAPNPCRWGGHGNDTAIHKPPQWGVLTVFLEKPNCYSPATHRIQGIQRRGLASGLLSDEP